MPAVLEQVDGAGECPAGVAVRGGHAVAHREFAQSRGDRLALGTVVRVRADAPVAAAESKLPAEPADPAELDRLATRYGLGSPIQRLTKVLSKSAAADRT